MSNHLMVILFQALAFAFLNSANSAPQNENPGAYMLNNVQFVPYQSLNQNQRTQIQMQIQSASSLTQGEYPNCGMDLGRFDERCCKQGNNTIQAEIKELKEQGYFLKEEVLDYRQGKCGIWMYEQENSWANGGSGWGGSAANIQPCSTAIDKSSCCSDLYACRWFRTTRKCGDNTWSQRKGAFGATLQVIGTCEKPYKSG